MSHKHTYDDQGNQLCCLRESKSNKSVGNTIPTSSSIPPSTVMLSSEDSGESTESHVQDHSSISDEMPASDDDDNAHDHGHGNKGKGQLKPFLPAAISSVLLIIGLLLDHFLMPSWFKGLNRDSYYVMAYLPVGWPVIISMFKAIGRNDYFSEFTLMVIATVGAMAIKQYPEAVAVMLFYTVGELLQGMAVKKAKSNIRNLLDQRPDTVTVMKSNIPEVKPARHIAIGDIIRLRAGEKVALDGVLLSGLATLNTAALTGESVPRTSRIGEAILSGMINLEQVVTYEVTKTYENSTVSKILDLVQHAALKKAPTELFIRRFARVYTPIVVALAVMITLLPALFVSDYVFADWLYRALVFLVISCPCALVISIPLGYFGGVGAASVNGILVKGSQYLDVLSKIRHVVLDKTGTLTKGEFKVLEIDFKLSVDRKSVLAMVASLESKSSHPIAQAIVKYAGNIDHNLPLEGVTELPGKGMSAIFKGRELLVGNERLIKERGVQVPNEIRRGSTSIGVVLDGVYQATIFLGDEIKSDAAEAIGQLHRQGIEVSVLSGDHTEVVAEVARELSIDHFAAELLPGDKVTELEKVITAGSRVAFVGDGLNDAPALALAHVGIAMGGLGSDAAIETADIVIQDDRLIKIPMAVRIGKKTRQIVIQNITLAFVVKFLVLVLGAGGLATMWEAVFADVGVALLAILNAMRIQRMDFTS